MFETIVVALDERVVVFKLFSGIGNLRRGDIVIFSSQDEPGKDLIKRVVAFV